MIAFKKRIIICGMLFLFVMPQILHAQATTLPAGYSENLLKKKGLLFRLTMLKSYVERVSAAQWANGALKPAERQQLLQNYNNLQGALDACLTTFEYKLNNNNTLTNKFNKLDQACLKNDAIRIPDFQSKNAALTDFNNSIKNYVDACIIFVDKPLEPIHYQVKGGAGIDPLELLTDIAGVVQFALTYQQAKTAAFVTVLDKVRLTQPKDIFPK